MAPSSAKNVWTQIYDEPEGHYMNFRDVLLLLNARGWPALFSIVSAISFALSPRKIFSMEITETVAHETFRTARLGVKLSPFRPALPLQVVR